MKRHAPATERNRAPLLEVLRSVLPTQGDVLEIASGSGEHAVFFAAALPALRFFPTDIDPAALASIDAWGTERGLDNLQPAQALDVCAWPWPRRTADAILCINMIHIAPFSACEGLLRGARELLPQGAPLVLYGPFREGGLHTAESNERFDEWLANQNPAWGVRDLDEVLSLAREHGLLHEQTVTMPANNRTVVLRRASR